MTFHRTNLWRYICQSFILIFLSLTPAHTLAAEGYPEYWKKSAYAIECSDSSLAEVLKDFAFSFGVRLDMSNDVGGSCQGWLRAENAAQFLDSLSYQYQFEWFVYQQTLYISSYDDSQTVKLDIDSDFKVALQELGLYQKKFGWGDKSDEGVAFVAGPQKYIDLIKGLLKEDDETPEEDVKADDSKGIYVIPVLHGSVIDQKLKIRDQEIETPGLASILLEVLGEISQAAPKNSKGKEVENKLVNNIGKQKITIHAEPRTNSLIIRSPFKKYDREYFERLIAKLDRPIRMIEIDAVIVEINKQKLYELGLDALDSTRTDTRTFDIDLPQIADSAESSLTITDPTQFILQLKALEGNGDASIVANASITTMENQSALIDLSETVILQTRGERVATVDEFTTGTMLNVTPQFLERHTGNLIKLSVNIEDGNFTGEGSERLRIIKSNVNTTAMIDENEALVIGGYHVEEQSNNRNALPILGDVPVIGDLFSVRRNRFEQRERIFILIPRVSPNRHSVEAYSYFGGSDQIMKSVDRIKKRWQKANQQFVNMFMGFVEQYLHTNNLPDLQQSKIESVPFTCRQHGMVFQFVGETLFTGSGLEIYTGRAINASETPQEVYEKSCFGAGLIGVTFLESRNLQANQSSRVLVAIEQAQSSLYTAAIEAITSTPLPERMEIGGVQ